MVKLVIVKNPFQPATDRVIKHIPYGFTARQMVEMANFHGVEINCIVDGETIEMADDYVIPDNQMVVLSPVVGKGKAGKIIGAVVGIALMVVGGLGAAGVAVFGAKMSAGVAFAFGMAGSLLMSYSQAAYAKSIGTANYETSTNDATYSWSGVQTMEGQNNPITLTYGRVKSGGQTIGKVISSSGDNQYLSWLVSAGEGELTFSDIQLNDNPISYYSSVGVYTRSGTNTQDVIPYFNDTYSSKSLGYQLLDGYRTETCQGNATQGIKFEIEFSNGLYYANDKGGLDTAWVDIYAEYRRAGGGWTPFFYSQYKGSNDIPKGVSIINHGIPNGTYCVVCEDGYYDDRNRVYIYWPDGNYDKQWVKYGEPKNVGQFLIDANKLRYGTQYFTVYSYTAASSTRISAAQSSALRREYRVDGLSAGEYDVRIHVTGRSHAVNDARASVRCYWSSLTSIVYDDFCYPNIALIGIQALATDQISGSPNLTFIKERSYVWVYVPNVGYQQKPANNPAWACYDMLHLASRLQNKNTGGYEFDVRGVPASHIIYSQFKEWADFCSAKQLYVNIEITQCGEMLETINGQIALIGRGMVLRFGTRYGCTWDCVRQPVQMFGMGNIISGTMQEEFLQTSDRANCVEITFNNADHDYERETITIYSENYDSDAEEKISQVNYNGITSYNQAYREGKYQLFCNKYLLRTVSFEANIDAIACTIGDVILVSHDIPKWAYSGRIYSVDVENNQLTLPIEMTSTSGQYRVMYRTVNDVLHTSNITIISNADGWCTVKCANGFDGNDMPQPNDIFDIALASVGSKPFVVKSITRASDFTRKIECIEYNENLYNENYSIPPVNYSLDSNNRAKNVTKLSASQTTYRDSDLNTKSLLSVSWAIPPNGGSFTVLYSTNKSSWKVLHSGISGDNYSTDVEYGKVYYVKVVTSLGLTKSSGVIAGPIPIGVDVIPDDVKILNTELLSNGVRRFWWQFDYPTPNDIAGFKLKYVQGNYPSWDTAYELHTGLITHQPFETSALRQGTHTVLIKAVDNYGQESKNAIYTVLELGDLLEENVLAKDNVGKDNWTHTYHNGIVVAGKLESKSNVAFWTSPESNFWTKAGSDFWLERYKGFEMTYQYKTFASGQFWISYDISGPAQIKYLICGKDSYWKSPTSSFWGNTKEDCAWGVSKNQWIPYTGKIMVEAGEQIQISVVASDNIVQPTIINSMELVVDVPDCQEHFEDLYVPVEGKQLNIQTPYYYTTAVRIDAVQGTGTNVFRAVVVEKQPCRIKIVDVNYTPIEATVDVTWQGYKREVLA